MRIALADVDLDQLIALYLALVQMTSSDEYVWWRRVTSRPPT